MVAILLLAVGVAGALLRRAAWPAWLIPAGGALLAAATGVATPQVIGAATRPLAEPVAFLLLAAPLAFLLDRAGVFAAAAGSVRGRHTDLGLWVLAAVTVAG